MGKRNQIIADLQINAEAHLKNSRNFINELDQILDGFDLGNKLTGQIKNAQSELKGLNKILEKTQHKSIVSDSELKDLLRAVDAIINVATKTKQLYSNFSTSDWQKMSKEYIAKVKAQEQEILKIKEEYQRKTGKIYDKEIANYDKILAKNKELKAQKEQLEKTGINDLVTKQVNELNQKLDQQKEKLQEITTLREKSSKAFQNAANRVAQERGFVSYANLKATKPLTDSQVQRQLGTEKYNQEKQNLSEVLRLIKEIEQKEKDINIQNTNAINIAKKYGIENVKDLGTLKEQYRIRKDILKTFTNDKARLALQYETELTSRLKEQKKIRDAIADAEAAGLFAQNSTIRKGGYNSRQSLNANYTTTDKSITNLQQQLSESGMETIVNNATTTVEGLLRQIKTDIETSNGELSSLDDTNKKLAVQSERTADEQDIKASAAETVNKIQKSAEAGIDATDIDGESTRKTVTKTHDDLVRKLAVEKSWEAGSKIEEILTKFPELGDIFAEMKTVGEQLSIDDITLTNKLEDLSYHKAQLKKTGRYLKDKELSDDPSQYQIIAEESLDHMTQARQLSLEITSNFKHILSEELTMLKATRAGMIKHDSYGNERKDENGNYILKKGYSQEELNNIENQYKAKMSLYRHIDSLQTKTDVELVQSTKDMQRMKGELADYGREVDTTTDSQRDLIAALRQTGKATHSAAEKSQYLSSTFDDIRNKISYFLSLNYVFDKITQKVSEAIDTTREIDKDMTQIGLVLGKTSKQVWKNFDTYSQMAERLNTTTSQVTNSMKLFYQQGLNTSEVNKMVEASAIAAALGESTMAEASETLTSIINSYNLSANEAMMVTDKISQIAIVSAADFGELSTAIEKVASSAASAGLDLDHMMGYLGKMIETTREAPTNVGTALKTIVANFTQFKEDPSGLSEEGSDINKVDKALKSVGISLTNTNGEVRDLGNVLDELGGIWDTLNRSQKAYLATQIAGTRQQSRFYALMNDYERTLELVAEGSNSAGKAQEQFGLYVESLEASTNRLTNQWEKFFNSITSGNGLIKTTTDLLTQLMRIANDIGPIGTVLGLSGLIMQLRKGVNEINNFNNAVQEFRERPTALKYFQTAQAKINNIKQNNDLSIEDKTEQVTNIKSRVNKFSNKHGLTNVLSNTNDVSKIIKYQQEIDKTNTKISLQNSLLDKITLTGSKTWSSIKLGATKAKIAIKAMGTAFATAMKQMIVIYAVTKAVELLTKVWDAATKTAEEYKEAMSEHQSNADTIDGLRQEYETLSKKVNKTAEEQKRLKEITEEVTAVDEKLGQQLKNNALLYETNIQAMKEYSEQQNKLAASNAAMAIKKENSLWDAFWDSFVTGEGFWADTKAMFGNDSDQKTLKTQRFNTWRNLSNARATEAGLDDESQEMLNLYMENLIDSSQHYDAETIKTKTGQVDKLITEFINQLQNLTEAEKNVYTDLKEFEANNENSYRDYYNKLLNSNLPTEVKEQMLKEVQQNSNDIYSNLSQNYFVEDPLKTYEDLVTRLSKENLAKLFNVDLSTLDEQEQKNYQADLAKLTSSENVESFTNALEIGGVTLENYINKMVTSGEITDSTAEAIMGLKTSAEIASKALEGLETFKNIVDSGLREGTISQVDILEKLANGEITVGNIRINTTDSIPTENAKALAYQHSFMTIDTKSMVANAMAAVDSYLAPLKQQTTYLQETYENHQNAPQLELERVRQEEQAAQNKVNTIQEQLNAAKAQQDEARDDYLIRDGAYGSVLTAPIGIGMDIGNFFLGKDVVGDWENATNAVHNYEEQLEEATKELELAQQATANAEEAQKNLADETTEVGKAFKEEGDYLQEQARQAQETYDAMKHLATLDIQPMADFSAVFDQFQIAGQVDQELASLQGAWDLTKSSAQDYRKVAAMIAADPSLINAIDMEAEHLQFSDEALENHAKATLLTEQKSIDSKIKGTEAILACLQMQTDDSEAWATATNEDIAGAMAYNQAWVKTEEEGSADTAEILSNETEQYADWGNSIQKAYQAVETARAKYIRGLNSESETNYLETITDLKGVQLKSSGVEAPTIDKADLDLTRQQILGDAAYNSSETKKIIAKYQDQLELLKKYRNDLQVDIDNVGGLFKRNTENSGGDSEDEYEGMIEKLEHFYNYLRQIEELEAKINKIREKRNLIDATQNYYIDDLKEENELLRQQSALYGNYIDDEKEYLAELRNTLSSTYNDWVYFTNDGLVQVKQTEFTINSEEEEEHYKAFSELLDEYQNEYNTMLENQNTLYSIQSTMVENINSMYDKMLQRLSDVTERLEYINSISEHKVTMNFGSIDKLPLLSDQIKTTADMLLFADDAVKRLEGDFAVLTDLVGGSAFKELLTWDETLQKFIVNNAKMNEKTQAQYEAQGYNWEDIVSWVESVVAASQKVTDSLQESNEQLMDAREALKDLLEERISTIDEIFEKATDEMNKFYGIYETKIESLGTENDLFGVKSENLDKQFEYLTQTATHAKVLLADLKENNQMVLNTLMKDYGQYVDMIDGVAYINKMAIEESDSLTEGQRADLLQLYQLYYDSNDQIEELNDKFYDYISQIEELEEAKRDAIIDLKQQVHDELMRLDQKEIDELSEKYAKMNALDNEYYSKLQQRISDARDARSRLQDQQNLTQMQNRLSVLQQDNSGQYNSELVELQRQINEQLQTQADTNVDLEMERIAREQQQRQEDREMQITQMENLLTFKDENGMYWEATQDMINNGNATVLGLLGSTDDFKNQSKEQQQKSFEQLQDLAETASSKVSTGQEYIASNFRENLKEFVNTPINNVTSILSQAATDNKDAIKDAVAEGTVTFIHTMTGLFKYLEILTGMTADKGYTSGNLDASGVYTMPTKEPPKPVVTTPPPATNTTNSTSNAPKLAVGSYVDVKPGTRWYYDSYGTAPTGVARSGKIKYVNLKGSRPYNIEGLGWIRKEDIVGYSKGGYVDYTGIAAVHGKARSPEAFLNAKQTALFETLRDALVKMPNINSGDGETGDNITIENLTIDVKELADTDSIDKVVKTVKDSIYRDATSGNNMKINRRR